LEKALDKEDIFWKEKSKVAWHVDGDKNTILSQNSQNQNTSKLISSIKEGETMLFDLKHISNHFKNLF